MFLLLVGLAIAVGLNVDSVRLATTLWSQPALRAEIAAEAEAQVGAGRPHPTDMAGAVQRLQALPLPIGRGRCDGNLWPGRPAADALAACPVMSLREQVVWDFWAGIGWLITAFAISLGAPFWFDLLQNIVNLRSAGDPPPRSDVAPRT